MRREQLVQRAELDRGRDVLEREVRHAVGAVRAARSQCERVHHRPEKQRRDVRAEVAREVLRLGVGVLGVAVAQQEAAADLRGPLLELPPRPRRARVGLGRLAGRVRVLRARLGQRLGEHRVEHLEPRPQHGGVLARAGRQAELRARPEDLEAQLHDLGRLERADVVREQLRDELLQQREDLRDDLVERSPRVARLELEALHDLAQREQRVLDRPRLAALHVRRDRRQQLRPLLGVVVVRDQVHALGEERADRRVRLGHERLEQRVPPVHLVLRRDDDGPARRGRAARAPRDRVLVPALLDHVLERDRRRLAHLALHLLVVRDDLQQQHGRARRADQLLELALRMLAVRLVRRERVQQQQVEALHRERLRHAAGEGRTLRENLRLRGSAFENRPPSGTSSLRIPRLGHRGVCVHSAPSVAARSAIPRSWSHVLHRA